MNVEIGAEAVQFPEKEYINGIAVAVQDSAGHCFHPWRSSESCDLNTLHPRWGDTAVIQCIDPYKYILIQH
jgi:hypothetical protein